MANPSQVHQIISMELSTIINTYIKNNKGSCKAFHAPFDVKLSDNPLTIVIVSRILQPLSSAAFKSSFIKIPHFFCQKHLTNPSKNAALRAY